MSHDHVTDRLLCRAHIRLTLLEKVVGMLPGADQIDISELRAAVVDALESPLLPNTGDAERLDESLVTIFGDRARS